jgi:hypothetical protein
LNGESLNFIDSDSLNIYKYGYKYPFLATEILSSEVQIILDKMIPELILEESKSYLLNLSSDSLNMTPAKKEDATGSYEEMVILDEIKKEPQFLFNPPEIEYGFEKEKEKFYFDRLELINSSCISKDRDISLNTSIEKRYNVASFDFPELLDFIFSFASNFNDANSIQSVYFSRIIISFLKSNKANLFIKYICLKKPEHLLNLINNIHIIGFPDIISKILQLDSINLEETLNYESLKSSMISKLVSRYYINNNLENSYLCNHNNHSSTQNISSLILYSNITFSLIEYLENTKNLDLFLNENFLNSLLGNLASIKNKYSFKEILIFSTALLKQFKIEYEKVYKFMNSVSISKKISNIESKIFEKTNILQLDMDILIINKFTNILDQILEAFLIDADNLILRNVIFDFICQLLKLSRNKFILNKFMSFRIFEFLWIKFYEQPNNNIFHNAIENMFNILIDELNTEDSFFEYFIIKSNFLQLSEEYISGNKNEEEIINKTFYQFENSRNRIYQGFFVQTCRLCHNIYNVILGNKPVGQIFHKQENSFFVDEFMNFYKLNIAFFIEKMNISLGNYKGSSGIRFLNILENILNYIDNTEDFCNKKIDFFNLQEINKNLDNLELESNRDLE